MIDWKLFYLHLQPSYKMLKKLSPFVLLILISLWQSTPIKAQDPSRPILEVIWWEFEPFSFKQGDKLTGFGVDLLEAISTEMEVDFVYRENPVTFPDMLKAMSEGQAEVTAAPFFQLSTYEQMMDFSHTAIDSGSQIVVPINGRHSPNILQILLSSGIFKILGIGFAVLMLVAHIVWLFERRHKNPDFHHSYPLGIWDGFWWAAVTITTVGYGDKAPTGSVGRVTALIWMFVGLIFLSVFTANITSALTVRSLEGNIKEPNDLHGLTVGTVAGTPFADQLTARGVEPELYETLPELLVALENNEIEALVLEANATRYYTLTTGRNHAKLAGPTYQPFEMAFALPTNSPYREQFNQALLALKEDGRYEVIYEKWFGERN